MKNLAFAFIPLTEVNLPLLCEWLNRPHLQEWWQQRMVSLDEVREEYLPRVFGDGDARPFLAYLDGEAVGYIQSYYVAQGKSSWWPDECGSGVLGIDQFLADGDRLGKGLGAAMISQFVNMLFSAPDVKEIRVDPRPDNLRAIRCYQKVGFGEVSPITTPDGPALMMTLKRLSPPNS